MVKPSLLIAAVAVSIALPAAQAMTSPKAPSDGVAKTLLQQINSGPDGHITRDVACGRGSMAGLAFTCDLRSVRSTSIRANVAVVGGTLRTTWEPIKG